MMTDVQVMIEYLALAHRYAYGYFDLDEDVTYENIIACCGDKTIDDMRREVYLEYNFSDEENEINGEK